MITSRPFVLTSAQLSCLLDYPVWLLERLIGVFGLDVCTPAPSLVIHYQSLPDDENRVVVTIGRGKSSSRRFLSFVNRNPRARSSTLNSFVRPLLLNIFAVFKSSSQLENREPLVWADTVALKGTGYRVYPNPLAPQERIFDLGYADPKVLVLRNGRKAYVEPTNTGLTLIGKGENARSKVLCEIARITNRRTPSSYTGNGVILTRNLSKFVLKPKKPKGKA